MSQIQLIKDYVEKLKDDNGIGLSEYDAGYCNGVGETCDAILQFIGSLPIMQPKFKIGDTIKGPCNNLFKVKEVLDKQYVLHSENGDELNSIDIVDKSSCIVDKPN